MDLTPLDAVVRLSWLAAAVAFVVGLSRMNSPATARNGNLISAGGMILAIGSTAVWLLLAPPTGSFNPIGWIIILAGVAVGGGYGLYSARTVKMTAMPQLVSLFNAVGGGAAALIAIDEYLRHSGAVPGLQENVATVLDIAIGSVTFTGSLIASGKLMGLQDHARPGRSSSRAAASSPPCSRSSWWRGPSTCSPATTASPSWRRSSRRRSCSASP